MAEDGIGSAGEDGRHPATVGRQPGVADGVDRAVEAVKATGGAALAHRTVAETQRLELRGGNDAVLGARQLRDLGIDRLSATKRNQGFRNVAFAGHAPIVAGAGTSLNARM